MDRARENLGGKDADGEEKPPASEGAIIAEALRLRKMDQKIEAAIAAAEAKEAKTPEDIKSELNAK